ncbi:MAG: hypothetical protein JO093_01600 [Acidobacteria bacterium]|nr:hypothetical protein [Acidobacteriota bacterium]MBV9069814.1 hypothetical protein [Acidobacteriota bacterium]MBV9184278.1 hypothetical protein [Acidobacteriota bacterium]
MRTTLTLTALLFLAAADPRQPFLGHWVGTSICTPVRSACHDETASYWMTPGKAADVVTMDARKIVDGKDEVMGPPLDFHVDPSARTIVGVMVAKDGSRWTWAFTRSANEMTGTLKQPDGQVVRNIHVVKQKE